MSKATRGKGSSRVRQESRQERRVRVREILRRLEREYPDSRCTLAFGNPLQLLVATILSAQCTDERVNRVTPAVFSRYPTASDYAGAPVEELEEMVRSTGFYRNKARALKRLGAALVADHDGVVPRTMEELIDLPGVGRKTANVVLGNAHGVEAGVVVDTHVHRVSRRLGLSAAGQADRVERDLMEILPRDSWTAWGHLLIDHGRAICKARRPDCDRCALADLCPSAEV